MVRKIHPNGFNPFEWQPKMKVKAKNETLSRMLEDAPFKGSNWHNMDQEDKQRILKHKQYYLNRLREEDEKTANTSSSEP